ncbi:hypothetical protein FB381_1767 [Nocardioides albertanoniae]|uniref:Cache domain-containing protein n=1 Tax=Nocardioides albertanoniae TaxID=1175486 RepID=A0A543A5L7_9ACTN|nr:cache domain-containing protein [Nocardioides albertanoniae]TQL67879.1 hypothetical protein FB381_1767 [Nocardioides albertanoniae]
MTSGPLSSDETAPVRDVVTNLVSQAFERVDRIATTVTGTLTEHTAPRRADLFEVEPVVLPMLGERPVLIQGAGFVAAPRVIQDAEWWLEWFTSDADGRPQRLLTHSDPQAIGFYDYEHLPWFTIPRETGRRHVTGPYVDYMCTEEYTLTFTAPVIVRGTFLGVAGADVSVKTAEQAMVPALRKASRRMAVVNNFGRILSSNSGSHLCGDLLRPSDLDRRAPTLPIPDTPFAVVPAD